MKKLIYSDAYHSTFLVTWLALLLHLNPDMVWTGLISSCIISLLYSLPIAHAIRVVARSVRC